MIRGIHLSCVGLVCPVGFTPESAAAALRARIEGFADLPYIDAAGEAIVGAVVPGVPSDLRGRARLAALAEPLFETVRSRLPSDLPPDGLPVVICTREAERPGAAYGGLVREIEAQLGCPIRRDGSRHVRSGPVAGFEAVAHVRDLLARGDARACLLVAIDTLIDARSLNWLDKAQRLKTSQHSDGVVPGEAACVLLASGKPVTATGVGVIGLGFGTETATVLNDEPLLGKGMAAAVRGALEEGGLGLHDVAFRLSDVAGESYAFEELVLAQTRVMRQRRETQELWHPADSIGDCGAAAGLIQFAWAEQAFARGYAPGNTAIAHGSATQGARAAALIAGRG